MNTCANLFTAKLDAEGLIYDTQEREDSSVVSFLYRSKLVHISFRGDDGEHVQFASIIESSVPDDKFVATVLACNQINAQYRYVKFAVDSDKDVMLFMDAIVDPHSAGEECFELLVRCLKIANETKPMIMKAIYG